MFFVTALATFYSSIAFTSTFTFASLFTFDFMTLFASSVCRTPPPPVVDTTPFAQASSSSAALLGNHAPFVAVCAATTSLDLTQLSFIASRFLNPLLLTHALFPLFADFARKLSDSNLQASLTSIPNIIKKSPSTSANLTQRSSLSGMRSVECLSQAPSILPATLDLPITNPSTPVTGPNIIRLRPSSTIEPLPIIAPLNALNIKQPVSTTTSVFTSADSAIAYKAHISTSILPSAHLGALKSNKPSNAESQVSMVKPVMNETKKAANGGLPPTNGHSLVAPARKALPPQQAAVAPVQSRQSLSQPPRAAVVFPEQHLPRSKTPTTPDSPVELIPETRDHPAGTLELELAAASELELEFAAE